MTSRVFEMPPSHRLPWVATAAARVRVRRKLRRLGHVEAARLSGSELIRVAAILFALRADVRREQRDE